MGRFVIRRFLFGLLVLWIISLAVFALFFIVPHNPARSFCGRQCSPQQVANINARLGLNLPIYQQYWHFVKKAAVGDFGISFVNQAPVTQTLLSRLPVTASLAAGATVIWLAIGIPIGVLAATRPRSIRDRLASLFALTFLSMPTFVLGLLALYLFFYKLHILHITSFFPGGGYIPFTQSPFQWFTHLLLPWFTLALVSAATYSRLTRGSLIEVLGEDYIRTARSKGLSERRVVYGHGLRAALTPVVTQLGIDVGTLLGGAIVTEQVFGLQGLGKLAIDSVVIQDLPVIEGTVLLAAVFIVIANILVDIAYAFLDPRVRLT